MRFKNYKGAIHNFAHSFQSLDFMKSGKLAINVLIQLRNKNLPPVSTFDFINKAIEPAEARTVEGQQLLHDYLEWLPKHFAIHNCDLDKLEKLTITIAADFEKATVPPKMKNCKQVTIQSRTIWQADGRDEQVIEISEQEIIDDKFLQIGIPEL